MRRSAGLLAVVAVVSVLMTGCRHGNDEPAPGEARIVEQSGTVEVSSDGRAWRAASGGALHGGDRVRVRGDAGRAVLALAADSRVELRGGSQVRVGRPLRLVAGDLLVRAGKTIVPVDATSAVVQVTVGGAARLSRGLVFDTAVYEGAADVGSGSRNHLRVPALRQVSVAGVGLLPDRAQPLRYRASDRWDREFLADWMELGNDLEARSNGLSAQIGRDQGRTAGFYRLLLPDLDAQPAFTQDLVDADSELPPGERLVGAAIASASTRGASFLDRWQAVFDFRAEGAAWGLVALDQHLRDRPRLVRDVDAALARVVNRPDVAAAAVSTPGPSGRHGSTTPPTTPTGSPPTTRPGTPTTTRPGTPTTPPTTTPVFPIPTLPTLPPPSSSPSGPAQPSDPPPDTISQLTDTLVDTVGGLLGGLQPPSP